MKTKDKDRRDRIVAFVHSKEYLTAMKPKEIALMMQVPPEDIDIFHGLVGELVAQGRLSMSKRGRIIPPEEDVVAGTFLATEAGYGFVVLDDKSILGADDLYIPRKMTNGAMHKDRVVAKIAYKSSGKKEGEILRVTQRGYGVIVGEYTQMDGFGVVIPDERKLNEEIIIPKGNGGGAVSGSKVAVRLQNDLNDNAPTEAQVIMVLGQKNSPGVDVLSILTQLEIPTEFEDDVIEQADKMPDTVLAADIEGRRDLRGRNLVTIDGADAKDIDDAISLERLPNGNFLLGVHIADVAHYVKPNTPAYKEALRRGTSVYPADRVVPMLPVKLSNGICSLHPAVDRLTLSCEMIITPRGEVESYEIYEAVIHSKARMTYADVSLIIEGDEEKRREYAELAPMFDDMAQLSAILRKRRTERGAISFTTTECKIVLDETGEPIDIYAYERNRATDIIEDFMLAANETVAEHVFWLEQPFVYRTHDEPDPMKLETVALTIKKLGYKFRGKSPKAIQKLLDQTAEKPETAPLVNRLCLRAMMQARYSPESLGHFGLAAKYYCHFTSPIRRFPDLTVHRILKLGLHGKMAEKAIEQLNEELPDICRHSSVTERRAEEAERETVALKKTQYMAKRLGERFEGVISGVTSFGIFVELPNTIEGMVAFADLEGDTFIFDADFMRYTGERTKKTYNLGDTVAVIVASADVEARKVGFVLDLN